MSKFKLIAADMDGTLLDDKYRVRPELLAAIEKCRARGIDLVLATGRLYPSVLPYVKDLGVTLPVIASNGAVVKDPGTGELLYHVPVDKDFAVEALRLTKSDTAQRFVNIRDKFYTDAPEETSRMYSEALKIDFIRVLNLEEAVTEDPTMVVIRDREEEIARMTELLRQELGDKVYLANSKPFFLDINNRRISKGSAITFLCQKLQVDLSEVIAIGDGWNDLEMFRAVGMGAAVANAPDQLKKTADYVCSLPSYQGVIEVIEKFLLD